MTKNIRAITVMALLVALSIVLVFFVHFPLFPVTAFLEYDPADVPILICAFAYGPIAGIIVTVAASAIQALTVSISSGIYGFLMHIIATSALCIPAGFIYKYKKTRKGALKAMLAGIVSMTVVMLFANHYITPFFMGVPADVVDAMLLTTILPFNLIKASVNCLLTFLIYKPLSRYVIKAYQ